MSDLNLKPKINLKEIPSMICDDCNYGYFREVFILKKVSKLMTGAADDTIVPFSLYQCASCGHVNTDLNPFNDDK